MSLKPNEIQQIKKFKSHIKRIKKNMVIGIFLLLIIIAYFPIRTYYFNMAMTSFWYLFLIICFGLLFFVTYELINKNRLLTDNNTILKEIDRRKKEMKNKKNIFNNPDQLYHTSAFFLIIGIFCIIASLIIKDLSIAYTLVFLSSLTITLSILLYVFYRIVSTLDSEKEKIKIEREIADNINSISDKK